MSEVVLTIDGREVRTEPGRTILEAAESHGIYIPRLCHKPGLTPYGGCRVCTVLVNGRPEAACTQPAASGMVVEHDTEQLRSWRRSIIEMLFVEGNHVCPSCEKSGDCELQALAYRMGISAPRHTYLWPHREVDASHPDVLIDHNRCILCARCVRTSRSVDGKEVFGLVGRGSSRRLAANPGARLVSTDLDVTDRAVDACPVGAILRKRGGAYKTPVGHRRYDRSPIGSDVEARVELTVEGSGREGRGDE